MTEPERSGGEQQRSEPPPRRSDRGASGAADVVDIWVNLVTSQGAQEFLGQAQFANIPGYLGSSSTEGIGTEGMLTLMDDLGVATGIVCAGMDRTAEHALEVADEHPGRFLVALGLAESDRPTRNVRRIRKLAEHPATSMVRVMPLNNQVAIDDARHYPVYSVCEELGIPVGINVGIPGPRVRSRVQHPELLEGVMIDFPDLVIIGAHMGHPYEELLMNYMRKWPNLYLSLIGLASFLLLVSILGLM
jgi:predicted TIM-barrel fold metal-dependent hydrolase